MDAVRALASYIEARARLGWTDPMIAVVLTNAGYPISADTLRSYRKRLRDEGLMAPLTAGGSKSKMRPPVSVAAATLAPPTVEAISATDIVAEATVAVAPAAAPPAMAAIPLYMVPRPRAHLRTRPRPRLRPASSGSIPPSSRPTGRDHHRNCPRN